MGEVVEEAGRRPILKRSSQRLGASGTWSLAALNKEAGDN